jgi:hypothetical protein
MRPSCPGPCRGLDGSVLSVRMLRHSLADLVEGFNLLVTLGSRPLKRRDYSWADGLAGWR